MKTFGRVSICFLLMTFAAWGQTQTFPALDTTNVFTGSNSFKNVNKTYYVDSANSSGWIGTDMGAWVNSADAAIGSGTSGTIVVTDGGGTLSTTVQLGKLHHLIFGVGTYNIKQILLADSTTDTSGVSSVEGQGEGLTTLFRIAGTNLDMISDTNFATLTTSANKFGVYRSRVANLTLDGNRANNTTGYGVRIFGPNFKLDHLVDQNQPTGGIWVEGNEAAAYSDSTKDLDASVTNVNSILSGGNGFTMKGPNDIFVSHVLLWGHSGWGSQYFKSAHVEYENDFLNTLGGANVAAGGGITATICQFSSGTGTGLYLQSGASVISGSIFASNAGIAIEVTSQNNSIQGVMANSPTGLKLTGATSNGNNFTLSSYNGTGTQVDFNAGNPGGGDTTIILTGNGTGNMFAGTVPSGATIFADVIGISTNQPYTQFRSRTLNAAGWAPILPQSNATIPAVDTVNSFTAAQSFAQIKVTNLLTSSTAPTISSGFGTSPSIATNNGTASFTVNVGTGGAATSGVIGLPTATNGWNCYVTDITTQSTTVFLQKQTASSTSSCTVQNFNTAGAAAAFAASDILSVSAFAR